MRKIEVTTEAMIAAYKETGSARLAAEKLGINYQSIYSRLQRNGFPRLTDQVQYRHDPENSLPAHPAIVPGSCKQMKLGGHTGPCIEIICPHCNQRRWIAFRTLRHQVAKPNWTGSCRPCWSALPKGRNFRTNRNPTGRRVDKNGYVALTKNAIENADLDMFDAMRGKTGCVFEHRWVMANHLGRPLTSAECVDHMSGIHDDNRIENLRIYVRGKQQPGSCPGHGTYYHEWQMAEGRIRELEARLKALGLDA